MAREVDINLSLLIILYLFSVYLFEDHLSTSHRCPLLNLNDASKCDINEEINKKNVSYEILDMFGTPKLCLYWKCSYNLGLKFQPMLVLFLDLWAELLCGKCVGVVRIITIAFPIITLF